jgi:hypothetical protein
MDQKEFEWRGIKLTKTAGGVFRGDGKSVQAKVELERDGRWSARVSCALLDKSWTASSLPGQRPIDALNVIGERINQFRSFLFPSD